MERKITGFHQDKQGDWVADLECGHQQHVRHAPPLVMRPWVVTANGRREFIGASLYCNICITGEKTGEGTLNRQKLLQVATHTKAVCLKTALEAYEYAKIKGLCQEGAWDYAIDATRSVDVEQLLDDLAD